LEPGDCVISADAKPSIKARKRIHPTALPAPGGGQLVEHQYERKGAITSLDAWTCGAAGSWAAPSPKAPVGTNIPAGDRRV
jgi:hypothetical protein